MDVRILWLVLFLVPMRYSLQACAGCVKNCTISQSFYVHPVFARLFDSFVALSRRMYGFTACF